MCNVFLGASQRSDDRMAMMHQPWRYCRQWCLECKTWYEAPSKLPLTSLIPYPVSHIHIQLSGTPKWYSSKGLPLLFVPSPHDIIIIFIFSIIVVISMNTYLPSLCHTMSKSAGQSSGCNYNTLDFSTFYGRHIYFSGLFSALLLLLLLQHLNLVKALFRYG